MRRNATHVLSSSIAVGGLLHGLQQQQQQKRGVHLPGWKTKQSTKDVRTREQREADRKVRQIEKLPRPEALHDFQYPHEKTVLADHMFQPPVFASELDTPHLFNMTCPSDFFLYWNCSDFDRTEYPPVPAKDHRRLVPQTREVAAADANDDAPVSAWVEHRSLAAKFLSKHQLTPNFVPYVSHEANLSVTFPGTYGAKARRDPETRAALPPPPPVESLDPQNFWFTSHLGNYIELCELQQPPSIFFTTPNAEDDALYTLIIASPDYPYRTKAAVGDAKEGGGFFVNYLVANLRGGHSLDRKHGDVVVPYVPPLPTEDAGTTRHMCMLFKQFRAVPNVQALLGTPAATAASSPSPSSGHFDFKSRCNFTLHGSERREHHGETLLSSLHTVERSLPADPVALTMFQTSWDIQVQEFYESIGEPEPAFQLDEEMEAILRYNALTASDLQVHARHQPDGSTNMGMVEHQLVQWQPTRMTSGSMNNLWSRRAQLGSNNKHQLTPKKH